MKIGEMSYRQATDHLLKNGWQIEEMRWTYRNPKTKVTTFTNFEEACRIQQRRDAANSVLKNRG